MRLTLYLLLTLLVGCSTPEKIKEYPYVFMTLDPGHFHAALVQKSMYDQVSPDVYVFAPEGTELQDHLKRIEQYNTRQQDPTEWNEIVYAGPDFAKRMLQEAPGNIVVLSGNNSLKTDYISSAVDAGMHVYADKPMVIDPGQYSRLVETIKKASDSGVILYDIMTERWEVTTRLQRLLSMDTTVFGSLLTGSADQPSVVKESVHYLSKKVSGNQLVRPAWFLDVEQQGEPLSDVATHLVDLVLWTIHGEKPIQPTDIELVSARNWPTALTREQYRKITGLNEYTADLKRYTDQDSTLQLKVNGSAVFKVDGHFSSVKVSWGYEAEKGGDTHYSIVRGTKADLVIEQGESEGFIPQLYIQPKTGVAYPKDIFQEKALALSQQFPGIEFESAGKRWKAIIPDQLRVGHEAHFAQETRQFLEYLESGRLPQWEVDFMMTKYYITTQATQMANQKFD